MGWWPWSSPNPQVPARSATDQSKDGGASTNSFALTDEQKLRIFGPTASPSSSSPSSILDSITKSSPNNSSSTPAITREQAADAEIEAFLQSFSTPSPTSTSEQPPASSPEIITSHEISRFNPDGTLNIAPRALYPQTMSCRAAFDQAFYCQSLGGKFNDVYRHGGLQSCSEQWGAFWFCMRTRNLPEHEKRLRVAEFYEQREEKRKEERGSSEDVWKLREVAVEKAFWRDPDGEE